MNHKNIPLLDLKKQYQQIKPYIDQAFERVMQSQHFILGPEVNTFELEVALYTHSKFALGVSSGSDALILALMALDIGPGDEVITSPYTFFATVGAISRLGATPVFVDIDQDTFNIDCTKIEAMITRKTKAIIPVHLFGQCSDMSPILELAQKHNIKVIEDAAQAIGASQNNKAAGSMGDIGCFSCFPAKNLGAFGDAGFISCQDETLAEKMHILRAHGSKPKYYHKYIGGNFRLDALQAAVLREKLQFLDDWTKKRQQNATFYQESLGSISELKLPVVKDGNTHVFNQYMLQVDPKQRDSICQHLQDKGIATALYYPLPLHLQECFADLSYQKGDFPVAELCALNSFAIPVYPELGQENLHYIVQSIKSFFD
ncbi:MAG TPA: DegT/DnrJ/EryC1/StrS family aminotransferase [Oligoflexia bacterium]|nr:DegT/DnrJ/EryC1/StrS family aminotransferase [Oligoflexia bacterium]HMR23811.1 DegT/DnrJ/EryC1/StrS family aminotransferase [Oligoflexia bacterium]